MEFIKVGHQFISSAEVQGLDVSGDGLSVTLHYGNTHKLIGGEDAQHLKEWAESRCWDAGHAKAAAPAHEAKKPK